MSALEDFKALIKLIHDDICKNDTQNKTYSLDDSVDCAELTGFVPLGNGSSRMFNGVFNGNGHVISNLTMDVSATDYLGFISQVGANGKVENLYLENINFVQNPNQVYYSGSESCVGAVAAVCYGSLTQCFVCGNIVVQTDRDTCKVGGLCGSLGYKDSVITASCADVCISFNNNSKTFTGEAEPKTYFAGGICGYSNGKITACHSRSTITPSGNAIDFSVGGICGCNTANAKIENCYNIGRLHQNSERDIIGGIMGSTESASGEAAVMNSYYLDKSVKHSNKYGTSVTWAKISEKGFAKKISADYFIDTTVTDESYTYSPSLSAFTIHTEKYLKTLCTPIITSFAQAPYSENCKTPVKITCVLINCGISAVLLKLIKPDKTTETRREVEIKNNIFRSDLGNNQYIDYSFTLTLKDKYNRTLTVTDEAPIPHIAEPNVQTGHRQSNLGIYHWVGNSPGPRPTPTEYFAKFTAKVSGATHFAARENLGTLAEKDISLKTEPATEAMEATRKNSGYDYLDNVTFATSDAIYESTIVWKKNNNFIPPACEDWQLPLHSLVWSMTCRCNLYCSHCLTREMYKGMADLSESEIQRVTEDIIRLGVDEVCLSGGEILLSPYWYDTAKKLSDAAVTVSMLTNGYSLDAETAKKIKNAGVAYVGVSIDDFHDTQNAFGKAMDAVRCLKYEGIYVNIVTTIHSGNVGIDTLTEMRAGFTKTGADRWCVKPVLPMSNLDIRPLSISEISRVTDFCYTSMETEGIPLVPAADFEMHTEKGAAILKFLYGDDIDTEFNGDYAGVISAQIHPNGSVVGTCVYSPAFSAGNVKERSLFDIWRDKNSFKSLRYFDANELKGHCALCDRRHTCKGGCLNTRLAYGNGDIFAANLHCLYHATERG